MKDVWHLFCSQISALRWWLLIWLAALTAWAVARWTYLTNWRPSWDRQEDYCWYGLMAMSVLLVAAVVHLHPPAERVAGWRAWPMRRWKTPAAQFLFILVFLVLLPGAAETVFLLHPRLDGFMGSGMTEWLGRSLWPLPVALGLAACSRTLRRFILDVLIFAAIVIGCRFLYGAGAQWGSRLPWWPGKSYIVYRLLYPCFYGGAVLVWALLGRQWISKRGGRFFFCLTPPLYLLVALWAMSQPNPDYVPSVTGDTELARRISVQVRTKPGNSLSVLMQMEGLKAEENADVELWKRKLRGDDFTINDASFQWKGATFGDSDWNPWSGPSRREEFREHTIPGVITVPPETLKRIEGKSCRLEMTARVAVQRSLGLARLPFRAGAQWKGTDREITVEFLGTLSDAARRGLTGLPKDSEFVTSILSRRFRYAAEHWVAIDVVHIPSGFRLHYAGVGFGGDPRWRPGFTHSATERLIRGFERDTNWVWASGGLAVRALSHPEEFEFIVRSSETVGSFAQEIVVEDLMGPAIPPELVPLAEIAVPNLSHPEAVESFFRTLERYNSREIYDRIVPVLRRCGPDILAPLEDFCLKNPGSRLLSPVINRARELNAALFKPERPDHRLAFFKGYDRPGLFMGADPSTPENNAALLKEGIAWVKEDPDNRLNAGWLFQMRNENVPALYPAIRRLLEKEGANFPWRNELHMPGLELPPFVEPPQVTVPRGPAPATESEFYQASAIQTGPQESYRDVVKQGKEWAPRVGAVMAASTTAENTVNLWLKV